MVEGAIGGIERAGNLAALFPNVTVDVLRGDWPDPPPNANVLIVAVDAASANSMESAVGRLRRMSPDVRVIVVLRNADVASTRRLMQEGAADVLPDPVGEPALALSLERLLARERRSEDGSGGRGEVVAFLKAGGGVGVTAIAVQVAAMLAQQAGDGPRVCLADLDLQFGATEFYLDLHNAVTVTDCLAAGAGLGDTPFATQLTPHRSGARLLAAPQEMAPLDIITPTLVDALFDGLRKNFALTLVDLPSVWTAWTNRVLEIADRIVLVTHLSVPHTHLVRRQLSVLQTQMLDTKPLILVCNGLNSDQQATVSLKAAERAIGRPFDAVIPEDRRLMSAAINQGLLTSEVKRKTKLETSITSLAGKVADRALVRRATGA